jgi:hypothetical protein
MLVIISCCYIVHVHVHNTSYMHVYVHVCNTFTCTSLVDVKIMKCQ